MEVGKERREDSGAVAPGVWETAWPPRELKGHPLTSAFHLYPGRAGEGQGSLFPHVPVRSAEDRGAIPSA